MASQLRTLTAAHSQPSLSDRPASPANSNRKKRPWERRMHSLHAQSHFNHESQEALSREPSHASAEAAQGPNKKWWRVKLFRGMINDVKRRAPFYWSDWKDAWDYRVVPATVYMYFAKYGFLEQKRNQLLLLRTNAVPCSLLPLLL